MRFLAAVSVALLVASPAFASPAMSADDAEAIRIEALGDRAPEKIIGDAPYVLDEPIAPVDLTKGRNSGEPEECETVPVRTAPLEDGTKVIKRINKCN
jgi:hypothetical protein